MLIPPLSSNIIISILFPVVAVEAFIGGFAGFSTITAIFSVSHMMESKTIGEIVVETLEKNMLVENS